LNFLVISQNFSYIETAKFLKKNLRGELTPKPKSVFSYQEDTLLVKLQDALQHSTAESIHILEKLVLPNIILHMTKMGYVNFVKDLMENDIDVYQSDFEGRNAVHLAAREGNRNMMKFLLGNSGILVDFSKFCI